MVRFRTLLFSIHLSTNLSLFSHKYLVVQDCFLRWYPSHFAGVTVFASSNPLVDLNDDGYPEIVIGLYNIVQGQESQNDATSGDEGGNNSFDGPSDPIPVREAFPHRITLPPPPPLSIFAVKNGLCFGLWFGSALDYHRIFISFTVAPHSLVLVLFVD